MAFTAPNNLSLASLRYTVCSSEVLSLQFKSVINIYQTDKLERLTTPYWATLHLSHSLSLSGRCPVWFHILALVRHWDERNHSLFTSAKLETKQSRLKCFIFQRVTSQGRGEKDIPGIDNKGECYCYTVPNVSVAFTVTKSNESKITKSNLISTWRLL